MLDIELTNVQDVTLVRCKGSFSGGADLERFRAAAFKSCGSLLLVDIREVDTIDLAGLSLLLGAHARAERRGGTLAILHPTPWVEEIFRMSQLDSVLRILPIHQPAGHASGGNTPSHTERTVAG